MNGTAASAIAPLGYKGPAALPIRNSQRLGF